MRSRVVRLTLTLLAVGAIAAAAYLSWTTEQRTAKRRSDAAAFENARMTALREAFELRAAQQAYVAAGQSETFWFGKVTASVSALNTAFATINASTSSGTARAALEAAQQALQDFEQVDRRVRSYVSSGQQLVASDLIFSDGLDTTGRITAALEQAGHAAGQDMVLAAGAARREQLIPIGAAALVVLISLLLLTSVPAQAPVVVTEAAPMPVPSHGEGLDLGSLMRDEPKTVAEPAPIAPAQPRFEMQALATVCTDLARLTDTNDLPAVLERAATALDASGLVLWVADPDGKELMPVAAHGYAAKVLSRLGTLKVDAENATSSAFRTGLVQTVNADAMSHGAIAAPLVTAGGTRGVMSAEVRNDGEKQPEKLAAAAIVAAQLATLVGPPAVRAPEKTAAL